jgi:hypothetical protein
VIGRGGLSSDNSALCSLIGATAFEIELGWLAAPFISLSTDRSWSPRSKDIEIADGGISDARLARGVLRVWLRGFSDAGAFERLAAIASSTVTARSSAPTCSRPAILQQTRQARRRPRLALLRAAPARSESVSGLNRDSSGAPTQMSSVRRRPEHDQADPASG